MAGRMSNKRRRCRSKLANHRFTVKKERQWKDVLEEMELFEISNPKGRTRSVHENNIVVGAIRMVLSIFLKFVDEKLFNIHDVSWTMIDNLVSSNHGMKRQQVSSLRRFIFEDGVVLPATTEIVIEEEENGEEDDEPEPESQQESETSICSDRTCLDDFMVQALVDEVDRMHQKGKTCTNQLIRNFLYQNFHMPMSRTTMARYFKRLGLSWKPVRTRQRNIGAYRMDLLRDYLISFDKLYTRFIQEKEACDFVFVYTDETYIHRTHSHKYSYLGTDATINRSSSKGERLIILHAITPFGPLRERDERGVPVSDLVWNGDTPHAINNNEKLTCELMWKATSASGDYHSNMNSEMFMKWVVKKLIPTFDRLRPNKKMVLICDNAAYHHKREIGSLAKLKKKEVVEMCEKYEVQYIDVPMTTNRYDALMASETVLAEIVDDHCRIPFDSVVMVGRSGRSTPFVPTTEELKYGMLDYFSAHRPDLLECKVTKTLQDRGHSILWTPPYTPDLQPIELFWAAGKNHAAAMNFSEIKMKQTVQHVHDGWYGNLHLFPGYDPATIVDNQPLLLNGNHEVQVKKPVNCMKLFETSVRLSNEKFVPMCMGLSGTMGALTVDVNHQPDRTGIPIDVLMADMNNIDDNIDDIDDDDLFFDV